MLGNISSPYELNTLIIKSMLLIKGDVFSETICLVLGCIHHLTLLLCHLRYYKFPMKWRALLLIIKLYV